VGAAPVDADADAKVFGDDADGAGVGAAVAEAAAANALAEATAFAWGRALAVETVPSRNAHDTRKAKRTERTPLASAKTRETVKSVLRGGLAPPGLPGVSRRDWARMKYRTFGRLGWSVSEIGCGMWGMGDWTDSDDASSLEAMQRAVDLGCNFFDTAWSYGSGRSEALLGQLVSNNPGLKIYTATKIPAKNQAGSSKAGNSLEDAYPPDHIEEYVTKSLANAKLESFDLVQFHTWDDVWANDERWARKMEDLRARGLLRGVGLSLKRWQPWNGVEAIGTGHVDAVQVVYNVFDQNPEDELFPVCARHGVAVIARVPLDEGTLTGSLSLDSRWPEGDWRNTYFTAEHLKASVARAEALTSLVPAGTSMAQMALRFVLSHPAIATTIPGMRKARHVDDNVAASDSDPMPEALMRELKKHRWDRGRSR
jgi:aryl-alcohol dehydrogenase-like predicted oxidoreductase